MNTKQDDNTLNVKLVEECLTIIKKAVDEGNYKAKQPLKNYLYSIGGSACSSIMTACFDKRLLYFDENETIMFRKNVPITYQLALSVLPEAQVRYGARKRAGLAGRPIKNITVAKPERITATSYQEPKVKQTVKTELKPEDYIVKVEDPNSTYAVVIGVVAILTSIVSLIFSII